MDLLTEFNNELYEQNTEDNLLFIQKTWLHMTDPNTKTSYHTYHSLNWFLLFFLIRIIEKKDKKPWNQNSFIFVREELMVSTKINIGLHILGQLGWFFHT